MEFIQFICKLKTTSRFNPLYSFFTFRLEILCEYISENLANRFIYSFNSSNRALIRLTPKPDHILRFFVNYCQLNSLKMKRVIFSPTNLWDI